MHRLVLRLWETHRPAVLLVTHDVDEALALADRVLVLGAGRIAYSADRRRAAPAGPESPGADRAATAAADASSACPWATPTS